MGWVILTLFMLRFKAILAVFAAKKLNGKQRQLEQNN
jgi:hypothetical protein